jgi:hypothetical protein
LKFDKTGWSKSANLSLDTVSADEEQVQKVAGDESEKTAEFEQTLKGASHETTYKGRWKAKTLRRQGPRYFANFSVRNAQKNWRFGNRREVTCGILTGSRAFCNSLSIRITASGKGISVITRFARPAALILVFPGPPL